MTAPRAHVHMDLDDIHVTFICEQTGGASSYAITATHNDVTVDVCGTPEQLGAFADAIVAAVSDHARTVASGDLDPPVNAAVPRWNAIHDRTLRWCFVCEAWVAAFQNHTHEGRNSPWVPRTVRESRQDSFHSTEVVS